MIEMKSQKITCSVCKGRMIILCLVGLLLLAGVVSGSGDMGPPSSSGPSSSSSYSWTGSITVTDNTNPGTTTTTTFTSDNMGATTTSITISSGGSQWSGTNPGIDQQTGFILSPSTNINVPTSSTNPTPVTNPGKEWTPILVPFNGGPLLVPIEFVWPPPAPQVTIPTNAGEINDNFPLDHPEWSGVNPNYFEPGQNGGFAPVTQKGSVFIFP